MSELTPDEIKTLAKYCVYEAYGADGPDVGKILIKLGYKSGMSEDTYFEMAEEDLE